jgi:hypothetical protein
MGTFKIGHGLDRLGYQAATAASPPGGHCLDCPARQSHPWVAMEVETKFLRLFKPVALGDRIDGWRVCWVGGWDECRVLFVVMVDRKRPARLVRSARRA